MSAPKSTSDGQVKSPTGAESPTTARPLEMDDDDVQESGVLSSDAPAIPKPATVEDVPPPKPPRPLSPQQQAENTLKEAFPSIDVAVVKAVLSASGGRVEPAFNALLGMSDPDAVREPTPPPQPPRPTAAPTGSTPKSQLEADEQYARQLAEYYGGGGGVGGGGGGPYGPRGTSRSYGGQQGPRRGTGLNPNELQDEGHSFLNDDLPIIRENLRKGFLETQSKAYGWISNLKKRMDGEDGEGGFGQGGATTQQGHTVGSGNAPYGARRSGDGRQSGDYDRYDADPQVLGDDFAGMQLNSDGSAARRSTRPLANPDLFKPTPSIPKSSDGRKVAFQSGPPEEMDLYRTSPKMRASDGTPSPVKQSKWQPLSAVEPNPIGEADNDPFSLGDSEDEKESKDRVRGKESKIDDADRVQKAAAEAMGDTIGEPARKSEQSETSGDKVAEEKST